MVDAVLAAHAELHVVLTGTVEEARLTAEVVQRVTTPDRLVDLAAKLSLGALLALVSRLRLFVGNDSAPAHFATALGTPSVVIFGSAHPSQWAPISRVWHRAVADETAPCRRFEPACGCPDDARAVCISAVLVSHVLTQVESVLALVDGRQSGLQSKDPRRVAGPVGDGGGQVLVKGA